MLDRSIPVVEVDGRLDAHGAAILDETWTSLPSAASHVVLDMTRVQYISSLGIRSLVIAEKLLRERRGGTILVGLSPSITTILKTTGLLHQFRQTAKIEDALELALAAISAERCAIEQTIEGCLYRVVPHSTQPCFLELWGNFPNAPDDPQSTFSILETFNTADGIDATLDEVRWAFGTGGFGSTRWQPHDCIGTFVAAGKFAAVLPFGDRAISDFVLSERPDEVELILSSAAGFSGPHTFTIEVAAREPVSLKNILRNLAGLLDETQRLAPPLMGFVMQTESPQPMLLVGLFSPHSDRLNVNGVLYQGGLSLSPKLEDLKRVTRIEPETLVQSGVISLYLPETVRLGVDKRLHIQVDDDIPLDEECRQIIRRLYRGSSRVILTPLAGGYNARTFRVASYDQDSRRLLPTVIKLGKLDFIKREEDAHRAYVQKFILNNSTSIMGSSVLGSWAALRYNFLGISGPDTKVTWLLDYYRSRSSEDVLAIFDRLYTQILKPWYGQPRWEPIPLFSDHTPLHLFPNLCEHAERDFGFSSKEETIECAELGTRLANPFLFLKTEYLRRSAETRLWYRGITHGDLNLRNILVDEQENLYVIDFSETRLRNIVSDFARMETILKFEMTRVDTIQDLTWMIEFEQGLAEASRLQAVPPNRYRGDDAEVEKAYAAICRLREYANIATLFETDIVPYWLALLEWTFSVLSYDLPPLRRKLAAYSAAILCGRIQALLLSP
jgi:anti-anti-sigma factor